MDNAIIRIDSKRVKIQKFDYPWENIYALRLSMLGIKYIL